MLGVGYFWDSGVGLVSWKIAHIKPGRGVVGGCSGALRRLARRQVLIIKKDPRRGQEREGQFSELIIFNFLPTVNSVIVYPINS